LTTLFRAFSSATAFNHNIARWDVSKITDLSLAFFSASSFNQNLGDWNVARVTTLQRTFEGASVFDQSIDGWNVLAVNTMQQIFNGAARFNSNLGNWNLVSLTTLSYAFQNTAAFNQNIAGWDVSRIRDLSQCFQSANGFNQNLGAWNTSKVTTLYYTFAGATVFSQNIGDWNTASVGNMAYVFNGASKFNENIGGWNTARVTDLSYAFATAPVFNQNLGSWNTISVATLTYVFSGATLFNQNIGGWNTANVNSLYAGFYNARAFNENIGGWVTSRVTTLGYAFSGASSFNQNLGGWNTVSVNTLTYAFQFATAFNQNIANWNTARVTTLAWCFASGAVGASALINTTQYTIATVGSTNFSSIGASSNAVGIVFTATGVGSGSGTAYPIPAFNQNIGAWDTRAVNDMQRVFERAPLFNQNIGGWNTVSVASFLAVFQGATSFNQNVGGWKTANVGSLAAAFNGATSFNHNIGGWVTSKVTDLTYVFNEARLFNQNVGGWNVAQVNSLTYVFNGASVFNQNLAEWDTSKVTTLAYTFAGAAVFNQNLGGWNIVSVSTLSYALSGAQRFGQDLITWNRTRVTVSGASGMSKFCPQTATLTSTTNQTSCPCSFGVPATSCWYCGSAQICRSCFSGFSLVAGSCIVNTCPLLFPSTITNAAVYTITAAQEIDSVASTSCNSGFFMSAGNASRICDGTSLPWFIPPSWNGTAPTCSVITCTALTTVTNAATYSYTNSQNFNSVASTLCNPGFFLSAGSAARTCGGTTQPGVWSGTTPTCTEMCPLLSRINTEEYTYTATQVFGSVATTSCSSGFFMSAGDASRTCDGTTLPPRWTGTAPTCSAITCTALAAVTNATTYSYTSSQNFNSVASLSCNPGFAVSAGSATRTCGGTTQPGTWSGTAPICLTGFCPATNVPNSNYAAAGSLAGTTGQIFTVTCSAGYAGGGVVECPLSFVFTPTVHCTPNPCIATSVANSNYASESSLAGTTGQSFTVSCSSGYAGGGSTTCTTAGSFSAVAPCSPNPCVSTSVANSDHSTTNSIRGTTGQTVTVTCSSGYLGGGTVTCETTGMFSTVVCEPRPCFATQVAFSSHYSSVGSIKGSTGQAVSVTCSAGYSGGGTATCSTAGTFNALACTANSCISTSEPNSNYAAPNSITGVTAQVVTVICNAGYSGGGVATCSTTGTFNSAVCTANSCASTSVPNSDKGAISGTTTQSVVVTCNAGFTGGGVIVCQASGTFTTVTCSALPCTSTSVANSNYAAANSITGSTGDIVTVSCNAGFSGGGIATCSVSGSFNAVACTANPCSPSSVAYSNFARADSITGVTGSSVLVACNAGYGPGGSALCQPTGIFTTVSCAALLCTPTQVAFSTSYSATGSISGSTGQTFQVTCKTGYNLGAGVISGAVSCLPTGIFTTVTCVPNSCAALVVLNSNRAAANPVTGFTFQSVTVTCDTGYTGSGSTVCQQTGSFDVITCAAKPCAPTQVANSDKSDTGSITGSTTQSVTVKCNTGYDGGGNAYCKPSGVFTSVVCGAQICNPMSVTNSDRDDLNPVIGSVTQQVVVTCNAGYTGGGIATCQSTLTFSAVAACLPNSCTPTQVANSDKSVAASVRGSTGQSVTVTCDTGFATGGTATCSPVGAFNVVTCTALPCVATAVANSDKSITGSIKGSTSQTVTVTCDAGYASAGASTGTAMCQPSGMFTAVTCAVNSCTPIYVVNSNYATESINGTTAQSVIVTCDAGYAPGGTATCLTTGQFSAVTCIASACKPSAVANSDRAAVGSIQGTTTQTVEVICDEGYSGGGVVVCQKDGTFSKVTCAPDSCTPTQVPFSTSYSGANSITGTVGQTVTVTCNQGYSGGGEATCSAQGVFNPISCSASACTPVMIANSNFERVAATGTTAQVLQVICNPGYRGGGAITCKQSGSFSVVDVCRPIECAATAVPNSNFENTGSLSGRVGDVITVTCRRGYGAQGRASETFNASCLPTEVFSVQECLNIDSCLYPIPQICGGAVKGTCIDVPAPDIGFVCQCNTGYDFRNYLSCVDTNSCEFPALQSCDGHGTCQDEAAPKVGFKCICDRGYAPSADATTCLAQCPEVADMAPDCMVPDFCLLGNGECNAAGNTAECGWDSLPGRHGGDCCPSTCAGANCGATANPFDCLDPAAPLPPGYCNSNKKRRDYPNCNVTDPCWLGDGFCDADLSNVQECGYDGGDCCEASCVSTRYICGQFAYSCKDPLFASNSAAAATEPPDYHSLALDTTPAAAVAAIIGLVWWELA